MSYTFVNMVEILISAGSGRIMTEEKDYYSFIETAFKHHNENLMNSISDGLASMHDELTC